MGVRSGCLFKGQAEDVFSQAIKGDFSLLFVSPELLIESRRWRVVLGGEVYTARLRGFIVDESHCIAKWYAVAAAEQVCDKYIIISGEIPFKRLSHELERYEPFSLMEYILWH